MFPYILFVMFMLFFYWNRQPKMMLLLMMLFAGIRSDIGWDYGNYYAMCTNYNLLEYVQEKYSVLWCVYFTLAYNLRAPHMAVIIPSILTYFLVYKSANLYFDGNARAISFALLIFALWPDFYFTSLSTIRQHLAVGVALYSFILFSKERKLPAVLIAGLDYLIHPSSIVIFLVFLILLFMRRMTFPMMFGLSILVVLSLVMIENIISVINITEIQEYGERYLSLEDNFGGKYKYVLALVLLVLVVIFPNIRKEQIMLSKTATITILGIVFILVVYATGASSVLGRVGTYFTICMIISLGPQLSQLKNATVWRIAVILFCVVLFFMQLIVSADTAQLESGSAYLPYKTIFS